MDPALLRRAIEGAEEAGVRLEMVGGIPVWEAFPSPRHQVALKAIDASLTPMDDRARPCGCHGYQDMYIQFPDGSYKRPDLAVYVEPVSPTDEAATVLPAAVVEVLSPGYEAKDLVIGVPFYLRKGLADVIVFDPKSETGTHHTQTSQTPFQSPATLRLDCGCTLSF